MLQFITALLNSPVCYHNNLFLKFTLSTFVLFFSSLVSAQTTVCITQIVAHEALDKVRQGTLDSLAQAGYQAPNTRILFENAQGNMTLAAQIAHHFVAQKPDVIIAIATPSAQAAVSAARHTTIPVVFATITDPLQAKLVSNLAHPGGRVTGTRNVTFIDKELALIHRIQPHIKTLGIILNYAEENSVRLLNEITTQAQKTGLQIKPISANGSGEVKAAAASLMPHVDAVLLLQDNTVASALPAVLQTAAKQQVPIYSAYLDAVKAGALAGIAADEYEIGKQTGKIAAAILQGKNPGDIAVQDPQSVKLGINLNTAKKLKITLNDDLLKQANLIVGAKS